MRPAGLARLLLLLLPFLLLLLLASGCTQPKDEAKGDGLFGLCPQWSEGPGGQTTGLHLSADSARQDRELGPAAESWMNHTLDIYRIRPVQLNATGRLELRAFAADDRQLTVRDYRGDAGAQMVPVAALGGQDVGQEFDILLSSVRTGSPTAALPVRAQWTLEGTDADATLEYAVTYHYKVCGAPAAA